MQKNPLITILIIIIPILSFYISLLITQYFICDFHFFFNLQIFGKLLKKINDGHLLVTLKFKHLVTSKN